MEAYSRLDTDFQANALLNKFFIIGISFKCYYTVDTNTRKTYIRTELYDSQTSWIVGIVFCSFAAAVLLVWIIVELVLCTPDCISNIQSRRWFERRVQREREIRDMDQNAKFDAIERSYRAQEARADRAREERAQRLRERQEEELADTQRAASSVPVNFRTTGATVVPSAPPVDFDK